MDKLNFAMVDLLLSIAGLLALFALLFHRDQWRAPRLRVRVFWAAMGGLGITALVNQALRQERGWGWGMGTAGALLLVLCAVAALILAREAAPGKTETGKTAKIRPWALGLLLFGDAALVGGAATPSLPGKVLLVLGGCVLILVFTQLWCFRMQNG
ncbi:MAG: hypothetical protein ACP5NF_11370 [Thermoanaerobaculum sp.]